MSRALTNHEKEVFSAIQEAPNIALVQTMFGDEETAAICAVVEADGGYVVTPLAVLVTESIMAQLKDPTEE